MAPFGDSDFQLLNGSSYFQPRSLVVEVFLGTLRSLQRNLSESCSAVHGHSVVLPLGAREERIYA